jgi:DNA-binding transcriptional ArsR family regulator
MPMVPDGNDPLDIEVRPSAPLELMWIFHDCEAGHALEGPLAALEPMRMKYGQQMRSFWGDGVRGFTEAVVLAQLSGTLFDLDLDRFFDRLDETAASPADTPSLRSESPVERRALDTRLKRLRADPDLRGRYHSLLSAVWNEARADWQAAGRQAVMAAAEQWRGRLEDGASFRTLLNRPRIWPGRPELDELADVTAADGKLVLSPGWFFGPMHVVELDGMLLLGRRIRTVSEETMRRQAAKEVSSRLKALADPTRVNIVLWLATNPSSVTQVAKHFNLSQPTVSAHIQVLREALLVEEKAAGRSSTLTVTEARLRELFSMTLDSLVARFPRD